MTDAEHRLRAIRVLGLQRDADGQVVGLWLQDTAGTGTSFLVESGDTVGAALDRVDERFRRTPGPSWTAAR